MIESAREDGKPFAEALVDRLAERSRTEILEFQELLDELDRRRGPLGCLGCGVPQGSSI